jgi:hypothetical protein
MIDADPGGKRKLAEALEALGMCESRGARHHAGVYLEE